MHAHRAATHTHKSRGMQWDVGEEAMSAFIYDAVHIGSEPLLTQGGELQRVWAPLELVGGARGSGVITIEQPTFRSLSLLTWSGAAEYRVIANLRRTFLGLRRDFAQIEVSQIYL